MNVFDEYEIIDALIVKNDFLYKNNLIKKREYLYYTIILGQKLEQLSFSIQEKEILLQYISGGFSVENFIASMHSLSIVRN